jgi:hypothetical protein
MGDVPNMSAVDEIKAAIETLPKAELAEIRQWFHDREWAQWDEQLAADAASGKLDFLLKEARDAKKQGNLKDL